MTTLSLGVLGAPRKPDEHRRPIHPDHLTRIERELARRVWLERGYGERFGVSDEVLARHVAGLRTREELVASCDIVLLPKPTRPDFDMLREGQVLWGWPHCVQSPEIVQIAIDKRLTLLAWEAMNHWHADGSFARHVFNDNNELAGYCAVQHAMQLVGVTGAYGRRLRAAVIAYGATGRGATRALLAQGAEAVTVLAAADAPAVVPPDARVTVESFERDPQDPQRTLVRRADGAQPMGELLATYDIVVNCIFQDTDAPLMFVWNDELGAFRRGSLLVDVSCDQGMGFECARPTSFRAPMFGVGDGLHYYAVDHTPSYLWNTTTWTISEALLPYLSPVMAGPEAWERDETLRRAVEIRDGVILNPKILSFQERAADYPHARRGGS